MNVSVHHFFALLLVCYDDVFMSSSLTNLLFLSISLHSYQKSSFNTYQPSLAPYVSIVPTSSSALLIRPPSAIPQQQASSILIGSSGLNNNPSILAQSPSNLGKDRLSRLKKVCSVIKLIFIKGSKASSGATTSLSRQFKARK
jgi:hypothetical protein